MDTMNTPDALRITLQRAADARHAPDEPYSGPVPAASDGAPPPLVREEPRRYHDGDSIAVVHHDYETPCDESGYEDAALADAPTAPSFVLGPTADTDEQRMLDAFYEQVQADHESHDEHVPTCPLCAPRSQIVEYQRRLTLAAIHYGKQHR